MHNHTTQQTDTAHDDVQGFGGSGGVQWRQGVQPSSVPAGHGGAVRSIARAGALLPQPGTPLAPAALPGSKPGIIDG